MIVLLILLYLAYFSVGVSDSFLGASWPSMYTQLGVSVSSAGIISMIIAAGTILSNLYSYKLINRLGTRKVIAISFMMTCLSLVGYSMADQFFMICMVTIPYGIGTGAISVSLIKYVALHYKLKHMNWLHCAWGLGSTLGPYVVGLYLTQGYGWQSSYFSAALLHMLLILVMVLSFSLWKKNRGKENEEISHKNVGVFESFKITGAKQVFAAFFCYSSLEATAGLWGSSYLVLGRGMNPDRAAVWISLFYMGITFGRLISGLASNKLGNQKLIRIGVGVIGIGIVLLLLPAGKPAVLCGLMLVGLGCAPVYPCLLQATPAYFDSNVSQALIGLQLASAYVGSTFMPPLFGLIAQTINIKLYPIFLLVFAVLLACMIRWSNNRNRALHKSADALK